MKPHRELDQISKEWAAMIRPCMGCAYLVNDRYCDYIGIVGKRRPCPPGEACTAKETEKLRPGVDYDRMLRLYEREMTDNEIAATMRCGASTVCAWRLKNGLRPNKRKRRAKDEPEKREASAPCTQSI